MALGPAPFRPPADGSGSVPDMIRGHLRLLRGVVAVDLMELDRLPGRRWVLLGAVAAAAVLFGLLRVGQDDLFTESVLILAVAMLFGYLSRTTGAAFVTAFSLLDLVTSIPLYRPAHVEVGRFIAYWLLWVLVVTIPGYQRTLHGGLRLRWSKRWWPAAALLSALLAGGATFLWGRAAFYLVRPDLVHHCHGGWPSPSGCCGTS